MKRLNKHMIISGISYELIKRNDKWAVFSVQGGRRYEVLRIYVRPKFYDPYWLHHFPEREDVSGAGEFLRDGSRYLSSKQQALDYFDKLSLIPQNLL